jgi:predicted ATPase
VGVEAGEGAGGAEGLVAALGEVQAGHAAQALHHADQGRAVVDPLGQLVARQGRGLLIVAKLAARWGRDGGDYGRAVWFEIDCPCPAH